jgi:cell division protein FtsW (lipid II flippase)
MAQPAPAYRPPSIFQRLRWKELGLFIIPFLILLLGMTQLLLTKLNSTTEVDLKNFPIIQGLLPIIGYIAALVVAHIILNIFYPKTDQMLLPLVGLLCGMGVLMSTRLGPGTGDPGLGLKQLIWAIVGLAFCLGTMALLRNIHILLRYKYTVAIFGIVLFCATLAKSLRAASDTPTSQQLGIGPIQFQPTELIKVCIVIFFAAYLSENRDVLAEGGWKLGRLRLPPLRQLGPIIAMIGFGLLLFMVARDLGLALLIYGAFLCMMYLGTGKLGYVIPVLGAAVVLGFVGYSILSYVQKRFEVIGMDMIHWTDRSEAIYQAPGGGFQVAQGLIAAASGGILGSGFGLGHPTGVPVITTDMVLTAYSEELGLVGLFGIIGVYLLLVYRGFRVAIESTDPFSKLLAAGMTSILALQTLIISAGDLKLIPLTGIPLPFLSYGGSALIGNFIMVGILLRVSHNTGVEQSGGA